MQSQTVCVGQELKRFSTPIKSVVETPSSVDMKPFKWPKRTEMNRLYGLEQNKLLMLHLC